MMRPENPTRKVGWGDDSDVATLTSSSQPKDILLNSSHMTASATGPIMVRPVPPSEIPASASPIPSPQARSTYLQALLAAVVCICLLWTMWLILLNVAPNYTVNRVMNTESFDNGVFWLFVDPPPSLLWLSVVGLSVAGLGYIVILVQMMSRRPKRRVSQAPLSPKVPSKSDVTRTASATDKIARRVTSSAKLVIALAQTDSAYRQLAKLGMKLVDLAFETVLIIQVLEAGSPAPIVIIFTLTVASNALACALTMFLPIKRIGLVETLVDLLFDLLIVVGCPMLIVVYCLSTFNFPRDKFAVNQEVFPPGWFEQQASVVADPVQTAVIYKSLKSLRIASVLDFFARIGVHATLFLRLRQLVNLTQNPIKQRNHVYPRRHRPAAALFVIFAILLVVFVEESVRTSTIACDPHPECVVNARRWTILEEGSLTQCPCLMMIDRDIAPKTYEEWEQPINVTEKVAQLASRGDLQILQLTNRFLPVLPDELRRCNEMRHLTLEYTHTQTLPNWIKEFTKLEFLHLESKLTSPFVVLPDDMFEDMSSLTFIHLAGFAPMKRLPSFQGLTNLKSLTLAVFLLLDQLPSFDSLQRLERLITCLPVLDTLPDFAPIKNVKSLILMDRGTWCCNGFLGQCDLSHPMCQVHPLWGTPAASCLASSRGSATSETLALIERFPDNVCNGLLYPGTLEGPPTPAGMDPCNGTLYRQCLDPTGVESMCYNARFMGIACDTNPFPIKMRRFQIARGVGDPCNPEYEAWLGCK